MTTALHGLRLRLARWVAGGAWPGEPASALEPTPAERFAAHLVAHPPQGEFERRFSEQATATLAAANRRNEP